MTYLPNLPPYSPGHRWTMPLGSGSIWCRYSVRDGLRCLDLANMEIPEEERGNGLFTALLDELEPVCGSANGIQALHIESVMNKDLAGFFRLRPGYYERLSRADPDRAAPSFIYRPENVRVVGQA